MGDTCPFDKLRANGRGIGCSRVGCKRGSIMCRAQAGREYIDFGGFMDWIKVYGAKEHNLKNIDVAIPKGKLTVITGPSGSGKSSLALDVLYTEGKRRYAESLSSYARQFLGIAKKPDFDRIDGLCPAIAIEQKTVGANPRSTVGTITEIYDYLRLLYARLGTVHCPDCFIVINPESPENITAKIGSQFVGTIITIEAPIASSDAITFFEQGYYRFVIDGQQYRVRSRDELQKLVPESQINLLIDMIDISARELSRVQEAIEKAFAAGHGVCKIIVGNDEYVYSSHKVCVGCERSVPELEPHCFSFNSPIGACTGCNGLGVIHEWPWGKDDKQAWKEKYPDFFGNKYAKKTICKACMGKRLNAQALAVTIGNKSIYDLSELSIKELHLFFKQLVLGEKQVVIGENLLQEIRNRLQFLIAVGLDYLSLNRSARTLSGGEGQRIKLATQIGSALSGVLYVLDEPSIGLHQRDNDRLIDTLKALRDQGNTVLVVEHDIDTIRAADYLIDMGPAAGVLGGAITAYGTPDEVAQSKQSLTGAYLLGTRAIAVPEKVRTPKGFIELAHATKNNLKDLTVRFPLGVLCGISGVSGSGKSSLIMQELVPFITRELSSFKRSPDMQLLQNMIVIDQAPIGKTPRSNPATYLGVFDDMRRLFAALPESNARGYTVGRFSFNVADGRCFECNGDGVITVEMQFLPEVIMQCKACNGTRYNAQTLQIMYKNKNIAQVLDMTAYEAVKFFAAHQPIVKRLQLLCDVGLDYIKLGQPSTTLSGGEAQRIKLVDELAKRGSNTLYILDEPTTGLHTSDIATLLHVLNRLVDKGNSMIIIEHNLDLLKTADYLIDLGPEGGDGGGMIVAQGTPQEVARSKASYTGRYLKKYLISPKS